MANPQKENGYVPLANEIVDHLVGFPFEGRELSLVMFVVRKTYGFGKKEDWIAVSQFADALNIHEKSVCRIVKRMVTARLLNKTKNRYSFNKNWSEWVVTERPQVTARLLDGNRSVPNGNRSDSNKRQYTKDTITKDKQQASPSAPLIVPQESFHEEMLKMPTSSRKKGAKILPDLSRGLLSGVEEKPPADARTKEKGQRKVVRERVPKKGKDKEAKVCEVGLSEEGTKTPPRLHQASQGGVALPETSLAPPPTDHEKDARALMAAFYDYNINRQLNFANKTERAAAEFMVRQIGLEKLLPVIASLAHSNGQQYAPIITTPYELRMRWAKLLAYWKRNNDNRVVRKKFTEPA